MLLPAWVAAFAAGIAVAAGIPRALALGLLGGAVLGAAGSLWRGRPVTGVAIAAIAAGILLGLQALPPPLAPLTDPAPVEQRVLAEVVRGPELADAAGTRCRLWLELRTLDGRPADGTVALTVMSRDAPVGPGDLVAFRAALHSPGGLANPGLPDGRITARAQGIDHLAALPSTDGLRREQAGSALGPRRVAWRLRRAMSAAITARVPGSPGDLLQTVVLGVRAGVDETTEDGFRAAGATHVLSVSGLHLAAVAALIFFLVRRAAGAWPALALRVRPGRIAAAVALPCVVFYTLLTGEAVATERSALMAAVALGAGLAGRSFSLATSIAAAALVLLVRSPLVLLDVSFQLSFASVIALGLFARRLAPQGRAGGSRQARALGWLARFGAATLAAGGLTAPLVAHHFGEVTPAAPLGNLLLVPLVELAMLPLGLIGALLATAHPGLGAAPLVVAGWTARGALRLAALFHGFAPVLLVRMPNALETAALLVAAAAVLTAVAGRRRRRWAAVAGLALVVTVASLAGRELARRTGQRARVTFLDVGQGDAAVLEGPGGFVAVIDGGGSYDDGFDPGARVIEPFLRRRGISRIDLLVLSHPHPDHLNGLFRLLSRFPVGALWTSGDDGRNPRHGALLALARARGVALPEPSPLDRRGLSVRPLGPWVADRIAAPPGTSVNDASLVLRVALGGRAVLFTGDLEVDGEAELVGRAALGLTVASDVIKVPHHGSRTSSGGELLDCVRPSLAVISLGRHNRFGFPRPEVLARYRRRHVRVLRTDEVGAVTVTLDRDDARSVACVRGCP